MPCPDCDALLSELSKWREGGVTEAMLRAHDGYIKIGNGCTLVRDEEHTALLVKVASVTSLLTAVRCYLVEGSDIDKSVQDWLGGEQDTQEGA